MQVELISLALCWGDPREQLLEEVRTEILDLGGAGSLACTCLKQHLNLKLGP